MSARRAVSRLEPREGDPRVYSVREIVQELRLLLSGEYPSITVEGEVGDYRPHSSGHDYFCLKDGKAQLQVAFFANRPRMAGFRLANGLSVRVTGAITVYDQKGSMQLLAERVAPVGSGALQAQFEALKRKLQAEGLFADERKRPLPAYPTRIALVTSMTGAAIEDMLRILRQRAPYARITVAPVRVQGTGAALDIAAAIGLVNEWGHADVIIVGRGGGSLEDLWAFNEEPVVRAIVASRIPVVSAVGHEFDVTLADLAADRRASTPLHAAQEVVPTLDDVRRRLADLSRHARDRLFREIQRDRQRLQGFRTHRALRVPHLMVSDGFQSLDEHRGGLTRALEGWVARRRSVLAIADERLRGQAPERVLERLRERTRDLADRASRAAVHTVARGRADVRGGARLLESYDYRGVLKRGYALVWTEDGGRLVNRGAGLREGEPIQVQFRDARARARVTSVTPTPEEEGS